MSSASLRDRATPYVSAILFVLIAFAIRYALDSVLLERSPLLIFTAAIVIVAGRYGRAPGVVAMILSLVLGTLPFMAPGLPPMLTMDDIASVGVFIVTSIAMLSFAVRTLRPHEVAGQLFRTVLAAPGTWSGRYPAGNTGGANVSAFAPMPVPADLQQLLESNLEVAS